MRIRISELRSLIGSLILEYDLQHGVTLYHRSYKEMEPGDVIRPHTENGIHWLAKHADEVQMEQFRQRNYPELPSRLESVYTTLTPASRFSTKGILYMVRPIGRMFVADSRLIDRIKDEHMRAQYGSSTYSDVRKSTPIDHYYAEMYWKGAEPHKSNLKFLEVLSDSAKVIKRIDEPNRLISGTRIKLPISLRGNIGMEVDYDSWHDELDSMKDDGIIVLSHNEPFEPREGSTDRNTWLSVDARLPKGYQVDIYGRLSVEGTDLSFTLIDNKKRKMYVYSDNAQKLMAAYRARHNSG